MGHLHCFRETDSVCNLHLDVVYILLNDNYRIIHSLIKTVKTVDKLQLRTIYGDTNKRP